jgi:glycosyltransferase involved in cell wall biosynthesis/SAM-dependent methyltransferase
MHAVTICARNYLPRARVLAQSYLKHNPEDRFTIFLVDAEPGEIASDGYEISGPHRLNVDPQDFQRMAIIYDVTELSTSLKPWVLESLLDAGEESVMYLDPDIAVYAPLGKIDVLVREHGIVLTPHTTVPMSRDGLRPTEADLMAAGTFNLGFIAVDKSARPFLHWWQERLKRDSVFAPQRMVFVDQRWIDLVPGYFSHAILTDPGYNVAYWNLDNRNVESDGDQYWVNDEPLHFFHFSGYEPAKPWVLSKYVADNPRVVLSEHKAVHALCDEYRSQLQAAEADARDSRPYRFNTLPTGERITPLIRSIYRNALLEAETRGTDMPPPPFEKDSPAMAEWLLEPVQADSHVNRYLHGVWGSRPDLRQGFPVPLGANSTELINWSWLNQSSDADIVAELLPPKESPARIPVIVSDQPGVNLAGYFLAELGVGQMGRLLVDAVKACGLPYSTVVNRQTSSRQRAQFTEVTTPVRYPINISAVNADQFPFWAHEVGLEFFQGRPTVGMWAWEVEEYPIYPVALGLVDEIWAISKFGQTAISKTTDKPVHVIPLPVAEPPPHRPLDRAALGLPEGPYFLFAFDYFSIFERKNPLAVVEAFCAAFAEGEGPFLVIKSVNGDKCRVDRDRLRLACEHRRDIVLVESYLSEDDLSSLMGEAAAYVSLHRSEGFGLTMAEAMARARPVIGTGYSGNLDFMNARNSLLVPYTLIPVAEGSGPYPSTTQWAQASTSAAAEHMRWVINNPVEAAALGQRARHSILSSNSLARTVRFVGERVAALLDAAKLNPSTQVAASVRTPAPEAIDGMTTALDRARTGVASLPDLRTSSRVPRVAHKVRRVVYRTLAHHDEHARGQLESLLYAVEEAVQVQQELRGQVAEATRQLHNVTFAALPESVARFSQLDGAMSAVEDRVSVLDGTVSGSGRHLVSLDAQIQDLVGEERGVDGNLQAEIARLDHEQRARPFTSTPDAITMVDAEGKAYFGYDESEAPVGSASYATFEDVFRGSEAFIAERMEPYLAVLSEHSPILDIGCGRGEFLGLLAANGLIGAGVDIDPSMVDRALEHGLDVSLQDGVEALKVHPDGSLGAVTSFQVVEHLDPLAMRGLFIEAYRVLRPGGVLVAETVNPHSPPALKTFWLDLTHVRPLFPESLLFLSRECGFTSGRIFFPLGAGDLDADLRTCGEYALIATKPLPAEE